MRKRRDGAGPRWVRAVAIYETDGDKIPTVVHQDGSARIQTVTRQDNALYHDLLAAFRERTGLGLLLNTSLNRRGTPIVETADNALLLFIHSAIDVLVMDDFVVSKPVDFETRMVHFTRMVARASARATFQKVTSS
jgi:carbamoyltransferase